MIRRTIAILATLVATQPAGATIYDLPPDGQDVIGAVSSVTASYEDTLVDIARRHGLGYQDVVRANPDVNVWLPGEGTEIILPTRFVLPPGPRQGLVLNLAEYRMYYFPAAKEGEVAKVHTYPMSIGRMDWETPLGLTQIVAMAEHPAWYPPQSVRDEHAADGDPLPVHGLLAHRNNDHHGCQDDGRIEDHRQVQGKSSATGVAGRVDTHNDMGNDRNCRCPNHECAKIGG